MSVARAVEWEQAEGSQPVVDLLTRAYWTEIDTVMNYLAASMSASGSLGPGVIAALAGGVDDEVEHTRALGRRIQELGAALPGDHGPAEFSAAPLRPRDELTVIESVIATELGAIAHYSRIMRATVGTDSSTHALALGIIRDEQRHLRLFERFRRAAV